MRIKMNKAILNHLIKDYSSFVEDPKNIIKMNKMRNLL